MSNQGFDPTERFRQGNDIDGFHETARRRNAANQFEAQHGAESRRLDFRNRVSGMRLEAGIVDSAHARVLLHEFCHSASRRLLPLDPREQCTQAPQRQIRVERSAGYSGEFGQGRKFLQVRPVRQR